MVTSPFVGDEKEMSSRIDYGKFIVIIMGIYTLHISSQLCMGFSKSIT